MHSDPCKTSDLSRKHLLSTNVNDLKQKLSSVEYLKMLNICHFIYNCQFLRAAILTFLDIFFK